MAVVTGAAQGIGEACARALAEAGVDLVLCDRQGDKLDAVAAACEASGRRCLAHHLDLRDIPAVQALADATAEQFPAVHIVVNNAGGGFFAPFLDVSDRGRAALVAENFDQVASVTTRFVPLMTAGGSIVNVTSIEAHRAGPGFAIYSAMKAAVENLTRTLALELASRSIRVNAIAPDMIATPGDDGLAEASAVLSDDVYPTPLGRYGDPADIVGSLLFLASDHSAFVTGQTVHVDGGTGAALGWRRRRDDDRWVL